MVNRDAAIDAQLDAFSHDAQAFMNRHPEKCDGGTGNKLDSAVSAFSQADIASNRFIDHRDSVRKKTNFERENELITLEQILPGRAPFTKADLAENLVDKLSTPMLRKLEEMEAAHLTSSSLKDSPWSDFYWPIYQGILGARYADPKNPSGEDWQARRKYVEGRPLASVLRDAHQREIDLLSPSEKYDLLIGQVDAPLTESMWSEGRGYFDRNGAVETWMGICHGWSPASFMLPRPQRVVTLPSSDARVSIRFFPSDLKALGSLLWASSQPPTRFIGGRCNDKNPKTESSGRILSAACFDTNPGTWHLAVINQIGVAKRGMIMDATFDYEVWNQPVFKYSYSYFNPITRKSTAKLKDAVVQKSAFTKDPFKDHRAAKGVSMVGIAMDLVYIAETQPSHAETDSAKQDRTISVSYLYDLELDAQGQILGGEWYGNKHPDFLWTPAPETRPTTLADRSAIGAWNQQSTLPQAWKDAALAGAQNGQPLEKIVTALFGLAK